MQQQKKELNRALCIALALLGAALPGCAAEPGAVASPFTATTVDGVPLTEWTARWWRWADTQRIAPYLDPDGRLCHLGQEGPVWFLAGTDGQFQPRRECVIPEGKHLLLPLINMISFDVDDTGACRPLQRDVALNNDNLVSAAVVLDGESLGDLRDRRVSSAGCFRMDPEDDSSLLAAADGYWLLLKPLPRGRHTLRVGANYGTRQGGAYSGMQQSFEYVLHVGGVGRMASADAPLQDERPRTP